MPCKEFVLDDCDSNEFELCTYSWIVDPILNLKEKTRNLFKKYIDKLPKGVIKTLLVASRHSGLEGQGDFNNSVENDKKIERFMNTSFRMFLLTSEQSEDIKKKGVKIKPNLINQYMTSTGKFEPVKDL